MSTLRAGRSQACILLLIASTPAAGGAQQKSVDTARVRAAYDAVTALRDKYERDHGHFAEVNGIRMHYLDWGKADGVPLVWAPGSASTAYELRAVAPRLADAGYRVLSVDPRGHGQTRVTNYEFGIQHIADDLIALLDQLKIRAAVFGGASKGGFVAAAVYDQYPERVLGLLMADGGTWSNQWIFDHHGTEEVKQQLARGEGPPDVTGTSEFDIFLKMLGGRIPPTGDIPAEALLERLAQIGPNGDGTWTWVPGFGKMMGSLQSYYDGATRPSTMPLLQWSQHALIPPLVFRNLAVPMMILDPQGPNDDLPVTDQNERLAREHPKYVTHRVYAESQHNILATRPDWFVRDAVELLALVRRRPGQ